jgi:hypothetical protein
VSAHERRPLARAPARRVGANHLRVGAAMSAAPFTPEARGRAAEARRAAIEAGAHYRRDWADAQVWDELAKGRGIRLPQWHEAPTPGKLKFSLQTLVRKPFRAVYGEISPARLIALNPTMPLRAFVGQLLELVAEKATAANLRGSAAVGTDNRSRRNDSPDPARGAT